MSRTYRRTGKVPEWVTYEYEWSYEIHSMYKVPYKGKELKTEIAIYHSDTQRYVGYRSIPKAFRREYGHSYDRQLARRTLHKEFYAIEKGNELFNKPRDISWLWW